jgi:hypothetical protein
LSRLDGRLGTVIRKRLRKQYFSEKNGRLLNDL